MWEWKEVSGYEVISFLDLVKYCQVEFVDYNKFVHWQWQMGTCQLRNVGTHVETNLPQEFHPTSASGLKTFAVLFWQPHQDSHHNPDDLKLTYNMEL